MKKTLIAAGILGAFAATAHAQSSVTLYGTLDAGLIAEEWRLYDFTAILVKMGVLRVKPGI